MKTPASIYRSLGEKARGELLREVGIGLSGQEAPPGEISEIDLSDDAQARLDDLLDIVNALADPDAGDLVNDALSDCGWTEDDFQVSVSSLDRAAHLVAARRSEAEIVARWWHTNRAYWKTDSMSGFELAKEPLYPAQFDRGSHPELRERLGRVVCEHRKGHRVQNLKAAWRPSRGIPSAGDRLFQIDVRISKAPERVSVDENGQEEQRSFRFLADLSIVVDPANAVVFVTSQSQSKRFRLAVAQEVRTHFLAIGGEPPPLKPLSVNVRRLGAPVEFTYSPRDGIESVRLKALSYRSRYKGEDYTARLVADRARLSLHNLPEYRSALSPYVYRGDLEFSFRPRAGEAVGRIRNAVLRDGHRVSYQRCSPDEAAVMERILRQAELLGPAERRTAQPRLDQLGRLASGGFAAEVRTTLGHSLFAALEKIGALKAGTPAQRAWCQLCLTGHDVIPERDGLRYDCRLEDRAVDAASMETVRFDGGPLARWLARKLATDQAEPTKIDEWSWFVGVSRFERGKAIGVALASHYGTIEELSGLTQYLQDHPKLPAGIVLAIDKGVAGMNLPRGWRMAPLDGIIQLSAGRLELNPKAIARLVDGRPLKEADQKASKDDLLAFFDETDTGLGPYEEADRILSDNPDWHWKRDSVARILKQARPERFAS
ncbi:MAG: hypothetical protein ACON4C_07240 [Henriciella sp.]